MQRGSQRDEVVCVDEDHTIMLFTIYAKMGGRARMRFKISLVGLQYRIEITSSARRAVVLSGRLRRGTSGATARIQGRVLRILIGTQFFLKKLYFYIKKL